jgi:hypothetical protein
MQEKLVYDWIICSAATDIKLLSGSKRMLHAIPVAAQEIERSM